MLKRLNGKWLLFGLSVMVLAGCFRQAGPDVGPPPASTLVPTIPQNLLPPTGGPATPFITPFVPGQGLDMTSIPTLGAPSPTLPLLAPGTTSSTDTGIIVPSSPAVTITVPFAAGPTFTPIPGAPPVNLNPNVRATATSATTGGGSAGQSNPNAPQEGDPCTYVVQAGDTAFYVATVHGLTLVDLIEANGLENADYLFEGQVLQIPGCGEIPLGGDGASDGGTGLQPPAVTPVPGIVASPTPRPTSVDGSTIHVVQAGENLFRISLQYGVTVQDIVAANGLPNENAILSIGQELVIPAP